MKVGILTYHRARNFGAFVQAYALQQQLNKRFPNIEFEVIDFEYGTSYIKKKTDYVKLLLKLRLSRLSSVLKMDFAFKREYKKLPLSKRIISNNTEAAIKHIENKYDCVIIGSDAVFNWSLSPIPNIYFFNSDKCKHVTYAASAHLNKYKSATKEQAKYVGECLKKMQYIGVRDAETERFVKYFSPESNCFHNCDPTVVLDMGYSVPTLNEKLKKVGISENDKVIILMLKVDEFGKYIKETYGDEYKIVAVRKNNPYAGLFLEDLTPLEWSKVFGFAKLTVTDFFHGSLLTLKNGVPVLSIDTSNYEGYESKAKDLFIKRLNLPEMFYDMNIVDENMNDFLQKCQTLLKNDYHQIIVDALEKEAKSFDNFCDFFKDFVENK